MGDDGWSLLGLEGEIPEFESDLVSEFRPSHNIA
jgi:hypothetical protein